MRSSPNAAAMRWSWPWISCGWLAGGGLADGGRGGLGSAADARRHLRRRSRVTPADSGRASRALAQVLYHRTGRPATSTFASATTCSGPIRSGRSRPSPTSAAIPARPTSRSPIAGTDRTLAATADAEVVTVPAFTGAPEQLWRIDQLTDGTYRIMPKAVPNSKEPMALTAVGAQHADAGEVRPQERQGALEL